MDQADHYHSPYHPISAVPYYRVGAPVKDHHHHHHHHQTVESAAQAAAVQSRILEMRKEKSRDAARSRRGKENHEFYELAKLLPLPAAITSQLDKASIIRLTISYLKLREFTLNGHPAWTLTSGPLKNSKLCKQNHVFDVHQGTHILQSLDGFAFALGADGRFLYISETVSIYLGLSQVEMTGSSLFDYVHQQDHSELAEILGITTSHPGASSSHMAHSPLPPASVASNASSESESTPFTNPGSLMTVTGPNDTFERQFCIRMKSTLTKRGCQHFKSSGYRVVHVISHLRLESAQQRRSDSTGSTPRVIGLVALAIALPPPSVNELRLESDMFVLRLGLDFKILHVEPRVTELLDFTPEELVGKSMYSFVYGQDSVQLRKCHVDLLHKGQVMSKYFRFMNKNGGHSWIQCCATLINNSSNNSNNGTAPASSKSPTGSNCGSGKNATDELEQCIICINYIISSHEDENAITDCSQLPGSGFEASPVTSSPSAPKARAIAKVMRSHSPSSSAPSPGLVRNRGSAKSSTTVEESEPASPSGGDSKRRRYTSSPVRPWKTPSPAVEQGGPGHSSPHPTPASNLLRHISVIRETPIGFHRPADSSILKPQVVTPPYHPHAAHHYHHLVDPYAAAYHLYKNGSGTAGPMAGATAPASTGHSHPWGYN